MMQSTAAKRSATVRQHEGRPALLTGMLLAVVATASSALAQSPEAIDRAADADTLTWHPMSLAGTSPYIPDPLLGGLYHVDRFAGPDTSDYQGRVAVRLANGDTVTAGLVPMYNAANPGSGLWNIGLVRYNNAGRVAWTNPGPYGFYNNNYVIYQNLASPRYQFVRDIQAHNGYLYVLVDVKQNFFQGPDAQRTHVLVFGEDGSFIDNELAFAQVGLDHYGATLVRVSPTVMMAVATAYDNIGPFIRVGKFSIQGNGSLEIDPGFGNAGFRDYYAPNNLCSAAAQPCAALARAAVTPGGIPVAGTPSVFIVGSVNYDGGNDWDALVLNISGSNGNPITSFDDDGWRSVAFDDVESDGSDYGVGLSVVRGLAPGPSFPIEIHLAARVGRRCHNGIGVAKLNGSGALVSDFGNSGKSIFGGQGNAPFCFAGNNADVPVDMVRNGNRLGIAGAGFTANGIGPGSQVNPMLAVVDTGSGAVVDLARHPVERADGSRWGDGDVFDIVGAADGTFTVAGHARDASTSNRLMFITGRFSDGDSIFANGFD